MSNTEEHKAEKSAAAEDTTVCNNSTSSVDSSEAKVEEDTSFDTRKLKSENDEGEVKNSVNSGLEGTDTALSSKENVEHSKSSKDGDEEALLSRVPSVRAQAPEGLVRFDEEARKNPNAGQRMVINLKEDDPQLGRLRRGGSRTEMPRRSVRELFSLNPREVSKMKEGYEEEVSQLKSRVQSLETTVEQRDQFLADSRKQVEEMNGQVELLKTERDHAKKLDRVRIEQLAELRQQLKQSEDDFEEIKRALEEREAGKESLEEKVAKLTKRAQSQTQEIDVLRTKLRRRDCQLKELSAEKQDVCLSARSFSERELISLRDEALEVKDKQISLINANCAKLEVNLVQLEQEIERLHVDITRKDLDYTKLKASCDSKGQTIAELQRKLEECQGQSDSIEVTTKQNGHLLQLLQRQESLSQDLEHKLKLLEDENSDLKVKQRRLLRTSTEYEVKAATASTEATQYRRQVRVMERNHDMEVEGLSQTIGRLELELTQQTETLHEEIRTSRERYYKTLERLQLAEEALRRRTEEKLQVESELARVKQKNEDLMNELSQIHGDTAANAAGSQAQEEGRDAELLSLNKTIVDLSKANSMLKENNEELNKGLAHLRHRSNALDKLREAVHTALKQLEV